MHSFAQHDNQALCERLWAGRRCSGVKGLGEGAGVCDPGSTGFQPVGPPLPHQKLSGLLMSLLLTSKHEKCSARALGFA
jgi:hypothetical protein